MPIQRLLDRRRALPGSVLARTQRGLAQIIEGAIGQMFEGQQRFTFVTHGHGGAQQHFQLADIARPVVLAQQLVQGLIEANALAAHT